ncbi:MAG: hypothetical protein ACFE8A_07150 [Candidatus Hodarchaeota archaeon]
MSSFFVIYTETPWDGLNTNELTQVRLLSLKSLFKSFPIVEKEFFDDLLSKAYNYDHYSITKSIKRIIGPNKEDYDISSFNFIWAFDNKNRMYQFLFQNVNKKDNLRAILVALAPPELAKLFEHHQNKAIVRVLSLLNTPSKVNFLMILTPKGKSLAEEQQIFEYYKRNMGKFKFINKLKTMPNIRGDWFPSNEPRCPICNTFLTEIQDYRIGFGKLVCPQCGYKKVK